MMEKVVLGLSGGVDSALAAALLQEAGYSVLGVYLDIGRDDGSALRVARELGIDYRCVDIARQLEEKVCKPFVDAYLRGATPNPCVLCNPGVKFKALLEAAEACGAAYVATGHYARVVRTGGYATLQKARSENDQSYMLCRLTQNVLSRLLLPLGELPSKAEVRAMAEKLGLSVWDKPDSMEICFIPNDDYVTYIEKKAADRLPPAGDFVDEKGLVLGKHQGIHRYTVGQRRGLGVAAGERLFVTRIEPETNQIVLGPESAFLTGAFAVQALSWCSCAPKLEPFYAQVKVRHSRRSYDACVYPEGTKARIELAAPIRTPARGQAAAFYDGDVLLGSGFIE